MDLSYNLESRKAIGLSEKCWAWDLAEFWVSIKR